MLMLMLILTTYDFDMQTYLDKQIQEISDCTSKIERRVKFVACFRLLMQQVAYGLLEWIVFQKPGPEKYPERSIVEGLKAPVDGSLVDAVEALLILAEKNGWSGVARVLSKTLDDRPARKLCNGFSKDFRGLLRAIVCLRNDGAEGHGLIGGYDNEAELDALKLIVEGLANVIPKLDNGKAYIGSGAYRVMVNVVYVVGGTPGLIRRVKILPGDVVRVIGQIDTGGEEKREFTFDTKNPFKFIPAGTVPSLSIYPNSWEPFYFLPDRTTDSFTGREQQISELVDWINDSESRACLIHGDGGLGKTTLALEFLNRVLEEELVTESHPTIIMFYTAKRTQWGLDGLQTVGHGQPHLLEMLRCIYSLLFNEEPPDAYYTYELNAAVQLLQQKIREDLRVNKQDILVVIDNAETLIEDDSERRMLAKELRVISSRIARIILTSRRYEEIEARPIGIDVFSDDEALDFLRDRASKLQIRVLLNASEADIKSALKKLEKRPIVLEAFVNAFLDPAIKKLDQAANKIGNLLNRDLGRFLFADAWARLNVRVKRLLLLMASVKDVHDERSLKICCNIVELTVQEAEVALKETGGIATLINSGGNMQVTFSKNFLDYAGDKTVTLPDGRSSPSDVEVAKARSEYASFMRTAKVFTGDRLAAAFRTPEAKAAHTARYKGDFKKCKELFESASMSDSTNGWLWDRYAYFLFHDLRDYEAALHKARKAVEFLQDKGEVWLTQGIIEARLGDIRACEISVSRAEQLGIAWPRCSVQRVWSYLKSKPAQPKLAHNKLIELQAYVDKNAHDTRLAEEVRLLQERYESALIKMNR